MGFGILGRDQELGKAESRRPRLLHCMVGRQSVLYPREEGEGGEGGREWASEQLSRFRPRRERRPSRNTAAAAAEAKTEAETEGSRGDGRTNERRVSAARVSECMCACVRAGRTSVRVRRRRRRRRRQIAIKKAWMANSVSHFILGSPIIRNKRR